MPVESASPAPLAALGPGIAASRESAASAARTAAAREHYRASDFTGAASLLEPLARADPPAPEVLRLLGLCRLRLGETAAALPLFERAWALAPGDPVVAMDFGLGLQAAGRHDAAVQYFRIAQNGLKLDPAPLLNLSTSLLALGDTSGAIAAARKGRLRAPGRKEGHYVLGTAYMAVGSYDAALDCFRAATRLAPGFVDAWVNMGIAHYRKGEVPSAKAAMHAALRAAPGHPVATANLAALMRLTGQAEDAEIALRDLIGRRPLAHAARLNLAAEALSENRSAEALELLEGPLPDDAAVRQAWQLQRAQALINLGRFDEARATLSDLGELPPALMPLLHWREVSLALADKDVERARAQALAMEAALETTGTMLPEHRIIGHYDLARFWLRQGEPDKAFSFWVKGHRHLAQSQPFSRAQFAEFVDATIALFTADRLAHGPRAGNRDHSPVFIVGMPRSGTTLLEQILSAHAAVHGAGERMALGASFWDLGGDDHPDALRRIVDLGADALDAHAARYLDELHALDPSAARIIDKMPGNFRHLGLMALLLPAARVLACDRDPRDIGLSIFTFRFLGVHSYAHDLGDLGWYIGQQRRLMAHWRAVLPNPMMTVRLTDWVEDFDTTLRRVLAFLDLPYDPACERFYEVDRRVRTASRRQVREKINARGIGRWRQFETHLQPLIEALHESGALE